MSHISMMFITSGQLYDARYTTRFNFMMPGPKEIIEIVRDRSLYCNKVM